MTDRNADITDLKRRVSNAVIVGVVSSVDHKKHRYRVKAGDLESDWLPMTAPRAGGTRTYSSLTEGEQVVVAAPNGDLSQGVIIGSVATNETQAADAGNIHRTVYDDGTVIDYDHDAKSYTMTVAEGGSFTLQMAGGAQVIADGNAITHKAAKHTFEGEVEFVGSSVTHNGVNIGDTHKHRDVMPGGALTGLPT